MKKVKIELSSHFIPADMFETCLIDGATMGQICHIYPSKAGGGTYKLDKFIKYLLEKHSCSLQKYVNEYLKIDWPRCQQTNLETGYKICGAGVKIHHNHKTAKLTKENPKFKAHCDRMSVDRVGAGNPMHGKKSWNAGLKEEDDPRIAKSLAAARAAPYTEERLKKMSEAGKRRKVPGHLGHKHSEESKRKMSIGQAKRYQSGNFNRKSSIQLEVERFLLSLELSEVLMPEYRVDWYAIDCAFPIAKLAVEVNGTFFHIDPRVYPNGPINAVQRRNFGRDKRKKAHLESLGWTILPLWEIEVRNGEYKEQLLCKLRELNLLKASA